MTRRPTFETRVVHDVEIRANDDGGGTFEGYACVYDQVDSYGTTFAPGAFTAGGLDERQYALLWMHDPTMPGGVFTARDDDRGLFIAGGYDDTELGRAMRTRALSGSAPELSVGFVWRDSDPEDEQRITAARLVETSQITVRMAAVPGSQISAVRHALQPLADALAGPVEHDDAGDAQRARSVARARALLLSL